MQNVEPEHRLAKLRVADSDDILEGFSNPSNSAILWVGSEVKKGIELLVEYLVAT